MLSSKTVTEICITLILLCTAAFAADANVAGTWTVTAKRGRRNVIQTLVFQQHGTKITGTFKGPRQSGMIQGTVDGNSIQFHVDAKMPLDYTGTVDGDSMKGTLNGERKSGEWSGTRAR